MREQQQQQHDQGLPISGIIGREPRSSNGDDGGISGEISAMASALVPYPGELRDNAMRLATASSD